MAQVLIVTSPMQPPARIVAIILLTLVGTSGHGFPESTNSSETWQLESNRGGIDLFSRIRPGATYKEFKAITEFDATPKALHNVLDDVAAYSEFMPYTKEARLMRREDPETIVAYQRLSPRLCSDRDYTLRIRQTSFPSGDGTAYLDKWEVATDAGVPEKPHVLRVKLNEGSWLLEPAGDGKTRVTYSIYTDSGGNLPRFLANAAGSMAIPKLFAALRKQAKLPKYSSN
jgi:hypothetical protein